MFQRPIDRFQPYTADSPNFLVFGSRIMVADVLVAMSQAQINCVFVTEQGKILGSFTEADVIRVCADGYDLNQISLGQVITPCMACLSEADAQDPIRVLEAFDRFPVKYIPVIDAAQDIIRVITRGQAHQDGQPIAHLRLKQIHEVLISQVLRLAPDQTLQQIAKIMSYQHQRYGVVMAPGEAVPIGVITLSDLVQAKTLDYDFATTTAEAIMSAPPKWCVRRRISGRATKFCKGTGSNS